MDGLQDRASDNFTCCHTWDRAGRPWPLSQLVTFYWHLPNQKSERVATVGIEPWTSSPGVPHSTDWAIERPPPLPPPKKKTTLLTMFYQSIIDWIATQAYRLSYFPKICTSTVVVTIICLPTPIVWQVCVIYWLCFAQDLSPDSCCNCNLICATFNVSSSKEKMEQVMLLFTCTGNHNSDVVCACLCLCGVGNGVMAFGSLFKFTVVIYASPFKCLSFSRLHL